MLYLLHVNYGTRILSDTKKKEITNKLSCHLPTTMTNSAVRGGHTYSGVSSSMTAARRSGVARHVAASPAVPPPVRRSSLATLESPIKQTKKKSTCGAKDSCGAKVFSKVFDSVVCFAIAYTVLWYMDRRHPPSTGQLCELHLDGFCLQRNDSSFLLSIHRQYRDHLYEVDDSTTMIRRIDHLVEDQDVCRIGARVQCSANSGRGYTFVTLRETQHQEKNVSCWRASDAFHGDQKAFEEDIRCKHFADPASVWCTKNEHIPLTGQNLVPALRFWADSGPESCYYYYQSG